MSSYPLIDTHVHLAGVGHGDSGCWIAPAKFNGLLYRMLRRMLGLDQAYRQGRLDQAYVELLTAHLADAAELGLLHAAVIFPHERVYRDDGQLADGQEVFVPNEWAFKVAEDAQQNRQTSVPGATPKRSLLGDALSAAPEVGSSVSQPRTPPSSASLRLGVAPRIQPHPHLPFLPAMAVHPYRPDAVEETAKWIERGAVAMKWLPNSQNIDPRDGRCRAIFRLLERHRIPLICHTGGEMTVRVVRTDLGDPRVLLPALEEGVTVVLAHCGTRDALFDTNWLGQFMALARQWPNCYGDTAALCTPGRCRHIKPLLSQPDVLAKLIHGSDFPVPSTPWPTMFSLGWSATRRLSAMKNPLARDVLTKRTLGFPESVFTNAAKVLPPSAMQRWLPAARVAEKTG